MRIAFLLAVATTLLAACSSSSSGTDVSGLAPTWTNVYSAVVAKKCLPCHATSTGVSLGKLDLSAKDKAYANLLNVAAQGSSCAGQGTLVVPGQASSSLFYQKVGSSPPCGLTMPFQLAPLSGSEKNLIKEWIDGGAKNN